MRAHRTALAPSSQLFRCQTCSVRVQLKCQALWAAAKGGAATPKLMTEFLTVHGDLMNAPHSVAVERAMWHLIDALRLAEALDADKIYADAEENLVRWLSQGRLRLWRIVAYMKLYARTPGGGAALFKAAVAELPDEAQRERVGTDLEPLLVEALQVRAPSRLSVCALVVRLPCLQTSLACLLDHVSWGRPPLSVSKCGHLAVCDWQLCLSCTQ